MNRKILILNSAERSREMIQLGEISNSEKDLVPPTIISNSNLLIDIHEVNMVLIILIKCSYCGQNKMLHENKHTIGISNIMELSCATGTITNDL